MLRRRSEFTEVLRRGARRSGERMVLYALPREQGIRVGFITGRTVGGAVERNRSRRRLKEAWRAAASRVRPGFDVVLVAGPAITGTKTQELAAEMEALLRAGGVLQP